jgi:hypothetical protein
LPPNQLEVLSFSSSFWLFGFLVSQLGGGSDFASAE